MPFVWLIACSRSTEMVVIYDVSPSTKYVQHEMREAALILFDAAEADDEDSVEVGLVLATTESLVLTPMGQPTPAAREDWEVLDYCVDPIWDQHDAPHGLCCTPGCEEYPDWNNDPWETWGSDISPAITTASDMLSVDSGVETHIVILLEGEPICFNEAMGSEECHQERRRAATVAANRAAEMGHQIHLIRGSAADRPELWRNDGRRCTEDWQHCAAFVAEVLTD